ncbi:hypothetical protein KFK09_015595 [Dendrobium nobile]|uniref:Uncharacterized protein n=1 Tax=Dendrobium nobile TaxID=94219 RepID=A0A8T3B7Q0_DENNO|nr:hypothetical protein KFK09_015595 [Dendrobium nobile]
MVDANYVGAKRFPVWMMKILITVIDVLLAFFLQSRFVVTVQDHFFYGKWL